jgi:hypothetical protein
MGVSGQRHAPAVTALYTDVLRVTHAWRVLVAVHCIYKLVPVLSGNLPDTEMFRYLEITS